MFRDETEAALARAEAAERKLAELERHGAEDDAQIEELKRTIAEQQAEVERLSRAAGVASRKKEKEKEEKRKQRAASAPRSSIWAWVKQNPGWMYAIYMVVFTIGGTAALMLGGRACGRHKVESGPGEIYSGHLVHSRSGQPRLLVVSEALETIDEYDGSSWRIDLVDPATGQRLVRRVFEQRGRPEVLAAAPGRFWCEVSSGERRLELRDVDTLDVIAGHESLIQRNPPLAVGLYGSTDVDGWSGSAIVTTKSGVSLLLDSRSLKARPFVPAREVVSMESNTGGGHLRLEALRATKLPDGPLALSRSPDGISHEYAGSPRQQAALRRLPRIGSLGQSERGTSSGGQAGETYCSFVPVDGGQRQALQIDRGSENKVTRRQSTFLSPELLLAYGNGALVLPGQAGLIVVHTDSLDSNAGRLLLSRLSLEGKLHWTVSEPSGRVKMALLQGELVVVAVERKPSVILGIAWRDGSVRWRHPI